jgi:CheY-like chemotaxis protein
MLLHAQLLREGAVLDRNALRRIGDSLERAVHQQTQLIEKLLGTTVPAGEECSEQDESLDGKQHGATTTLTGGQTTPITRRSLDRPGKMKQYEALKNIRVLYIDDDFRTREAVLEVLELTGAHVALAASTADGMMALDTFKPHVILCDLAMPGEDGYTFMRKLRMYEMGRAPQIPVLAFTALASAADKRDALAAGFQLHLAKPIDIDRLRDSVLQLVQLIGSTSATGL